MTSNKFHPGQLLIPQSAHLCMLKKIVTFIPLMMIFLNLVAQKGNNELNITGEAGTTINQNARCFGGFIKGLYGIRKSAQLTFSAGLLNCRNKNTLREEQSSTRLVPFLVGYRQYLHRFFVEPQMGIGELGGRIKMEGDYVRPSVAALFGAIGLGYSFGKITGGIRFQTAQGIEGRDAGTWHDKNFHYAGIFIGYDLFSKQ
ncbi:MAG: hypothetical protein WKI04_15065 [Ferruginibacter sp.]